MDTVTSASTPSVQTRLKETHRPNIAYVYGYSEELLLV
jgi:hypothetical protein